MMTTTVMDAVDQLDFSKTSLIERNQDTTIITTTTETDDADTTTTTTTTTAAAALHDFHDFKQSASVVAINKETKQGNLVETKGTIAKHANIDATTITMNTTNGNVSETVHIVQPESTAAVAATTLVVVTTTSTPSDNNIVTMEEKQEDIRSSKDARRFVSAKDFDLLKVIGMGAFGKVLQVRHKYTSRILAMKVISKRLLLRKSGYVENIRAERQILTRVRSPFVVTMHCSFQTREKLFIIMDFLAGGELFLRLGREGIFLEKTAAFYLGEIILAIDHLHTLGILHRDLKPENILLGADGHVCVTDFGLAKDFSHVGGFDDEENRALTICGTQEYMAPEMLSGQGYGRSADYWSLGCIAYEMLAGWPPFKSKDGRKELFRKIMSEKVKMPSGSTAEACKLLKGLLNRNVQKRLGAAKSTMFEVGGVSALKNEPFFAHINWDSLASKQTEPPQVLSVQDDQDLKHFHQEFTDMALPRSVVLMSQNTFQPHHVESQRFRGFSFIHDSFDLPERPDEELETYWNSIEEDAVSLSECASSKMENDVNEQLSSESPTKKRPPRKRKKNKKDIPITTPATFQASPLPSDQGDEFISLQQQDNGDGKLTEAKSLAQATPQLVPQEPQNDVPLKRTNNSTTDGATSWQNVVNREYKSVKEKEIKSSAMQQLYRHNENTDIPSFSQESKKPAWQTKSELHSQLPTSRPLPWDRSTQQGRGTWGQFPGTSPRSLPSQTKHTTQPIPPLQASAQPLPSSDWRHHSMSSRRQISLEQQQQSRSQPSWPALGDGQGKKLSSVLTPPATTTKPVLQGAWASKVLK